MFVITTMGSNDNDAVFPFATTKATIERGEPVSMFLMSEATRIGTTIGDSYEMTAPGMPSVGELRDEILASDLLEEFIVCEPCGVPRGATQDNLIEEAVFGDGSDEARLIAEHDTTLTW